MNHSYRLVWNESSQSYVAAPECARGKGKAGKGRLKPLALVLGTCLGSWLGNPAFAAPPAANALPTGGQVVAGQASVAQSGNAMTVTQGSDKAILNWQTFDIGSQASVRFVQPSTGSVALNRVLSGEASQIYGKLGANGHVFLVNPAGVVFGAGSKIDVGGLVASTMDITNEDFLAGRLDFKRNGATGGISNQGEITAGDGGLVALLASTVKNEGVLSARLGTVALAAGDRVTLPAGANGHLQLAVEPSTVRTLVENRQMILADGGQVLMTSRAADALSAGVVANSGTIRAQTLQEHEGRILLLADMAHGEVRHSGLLDASAPNGGDGGFVETSAATVSLEGQRKVTTLAPLGKTGTWLIDPNDYTIAASGGNITGAQLSSDLALSNVTIATASQGTSGGNGDIFVNAPVTWSANTTLSLQAQRYIEINADITATGNTAGLVLGTQYDYRLGHGARITLSGAAPTLKIGNPGSEYNYTVINTLAALQAMNNNRSGRYALGSDIDATATETWNGGAGFQPIGTKGAAFSGVFAGLGHTIGKLTINAPGQSTVGLFGMIQSALLRDFGLKAATIRGGSDYYVFDEGTGPIVGWAKSSNIRNVYAIDTGTSSTASGVGGLVGLLDGSTLDNSYATGTVKALVGAGYAGLGGLVGHLSSGASITDSYTKAQVSDESGTAYAGPLAGVGSAGTGAMSSIIRSYAFNYCSPCSGNPTSGIIGFSEVPLIVFSSYYNDGWGSSQAYGTPIGNSTRASSYAGLDFVKTWRIYEDQSTPVLRAFQRDAFVTVDSAGKTYDGSAWNAPGYTASGAPVGGSVSFSGSYKNAVNAGNYSIVASGLGFTRNEAQDYQDFGDVVYVNGTLTIAPRPITVQAADQTRVFGNANPTSGSLALTAGSLVGGDTLGNASLSSSATATAAAGQSFALTPDNAAFASGSAGNYAITYQNGTLTIAQRPITVQASNQTRAYGSANPASGGLVLTGGSLANGDTLGNASLSSSATASSAAGQSFALAPDNAAFASGSAGNYAITYQNGTLTIAQAPLTVAANSSGKTYDGLAWNGIPSVTYSGFVNGETAAALGGALAFGGNAQGAVNAGSYTIAPSGLSSGNYAITYQNGTLTITQAPLTVAANSSSKTYDGIAWNGAPGATYSGFVNGETAAALGGALAFGGNAQGAVNAGSYMIAPSGLSSGNYAITFQNGALTIAPRAITVKTGDLTRVFGDANPTSGGLILAAGSLVGGDTLGNASLSSSATATAAAGQSFALTPDNAAFASGSAGNYAISYQNGTLTIAQRPITVQASNQTRTYGSANPASGGLVLTGGSLANGDTLGNASLSSSATATAAAGQSFALTPDNAAFASGSAGNYAITYQNGTLTITQAPLTVAANNASKTYDGLAWNGIPGVTYSGFVNGETAAALGGALAFGGNAQGAVNAGSYTIAPSGLTSGNYAITFQDGALTIAKAPLTVAANSAAKTYDGLAWNGIPGATYSGFVNGETAAALGGVLAFGGNAQGATNAGSYTIAPSGLSSGNYAITFQDGALIVAKAPLTVAANSSGKTYDGIAWNGAPGATYSGFVNGETAAALGGALSFADSVQGAVNAGSYTIAPSGLSSGNYAITFQNGALTIAPRAITVKTGDLTRVFGDANPASGGLVLTGGSLANGDTLGNASLSSSATATSAAGQSFALTPDNAAFASGSAGNYAITYQNGTLTIAQRPITVQASNQTRTYGSANPASGGLIITGGSLANGDTLGNASLSSSATASSAAGQSFALTPDNAAFASGSAGNYAITYQNGTLTITQAPLTVAANNATKTYDGIAWTGGNGVSYSGFINGETAGVLGGTLTYAGSSQDARETGSYVIAVNGLTSGNYAISFRSGTLTIAPVAPAGGPPSAAPGGAQIALANPVATAQRPSAPPTHLAARNPEGGRGAMNSPYLTVSANSIRIDE